jgi:hypothetical protein
MAGSSADLTIYYAIPLAYLLVPLLWHQLLGDHASRRRSVLLALHLHDPLTDYAAPLATELV